MKVSFAELLVAATYAATGKTCAIVAAFINSVFVENISPPARWDHFAAQSLQNYYKTQTLQKSTEQQAAMAIPEQLVV